MSARSQFNEDYQKNESRRDEEGQSIPDAEGSVNFDDDASDGSTIPFDSETPENPVEIIPSSANRGEYIYIYIYIYYIYMYQ